MGYRQVAERLCVSLQLNTRVQSTPWRQNTSKRSRACHELGGDAPAVIGCLRTT